MQRVLKSFHVHFHSRKTALQRGPCGCHPKPNSPNFLPQQMLKDVWALFETLSVLLRYLDFQRTLQNTSNLTSLNLPLVSKDLCNKLPPQPLRAGKSENDLFSLNPHFGSPENLYSSHLNMAALPSNWSWEPHLADRSQKQAHPCCC